jgi:hypothetical protein
VLPALNLKLEDILNYTFRFPYLALIISLLSMMPSSYADVLENRISTETRPVEFDIGGGHYAIPRNYLYQMDGWKGGRQDVVSIRLEYPTLRPAEEHNKDCFFQKKVCRLYDVVLLSSAMETTEIFSNMTKLFREPYPKHGPYDLELYEVGPESARQQFYRKVIDGRSIVFICDYFDNRGRRDAVCHNVTRTRSGATFSYYFPFEDLHDAVGVNKKLKNLVNSFSSRGRR